MSPFAPSKRNASVFVGVPSSSMCTLPSKPITERIRIGLSCPWGSLFGSITDSITVSTSPSLRFENEIGPWWISCCSTMREEFPNSTVVQALDDVSPRSNRFGSRVTRTPGAGVSMPTSRAAFWYSRSAMKPPAMGASPRARRPTMKRPITSFRMSETPADCFATLYHAGAGAPRRLACETCGAPYVFVKSSLTLHSGALSSGAPIPQPRVAER